MRIISSVHGFPNWIWKPGPIAVQIARNRAASNHWPTILEVDRTLSFLTERIGNTAPFSRPRQWRITLGYARSMTRCQLWTPSSPAWRPRSGGSPRLWSPWRESWGKWISIWGSLWKQGAMTTLDKRGSIKIHGWSMTAGPALVGEIKLSVRSKHVPLYNVRALGQWRASVVQRVN